MSSSQTQNLDSDAEDAKPEIKLDQTEAEQLTTKVELLAMYTKMARLWLRRELPTYLKRAIHEYMDKNSELEARMLRQIILMSSDDVEFED